MSSILVIGGTGNIGQHLVTASLKAGHRTAVLVRPTTVASDSDKAKLLNSLEARGVSVVYGDMNNHKSLVAAIKQHGEVVISAVGHGRPEELDGQLKIIEAIKEVGCVKRFVPSEFGCDVEHHVEHTLEPANSMIVTPKLRVRRAIRDAGIPHTIICSYWATGLLFSTLGNSGENGPLSTGVDIFGDENSRAIFVNEKDMSMLTIRAVEDPRTLDKILHVRPPANMRSFGQLVHLLEKKTGKTFERHYVTEPELVKKIQEAPFPLNFQLAMVHSTVAHAGACEHAVDPAVSVEATLLYPDVQFIKVEDCLDGFLPAF
ncbi:phenylcoumaran benzylic ether reductase Pyrc5-like [Hordeum vulgare subsp. vulgare]|uniref:NmrA-like domain-containing protein n=1 Tax=Hordeum vulgare subsp. vulgare TaxID=112509 RepID=A0A8I6X694_HORVV|nr:phenylcoumaran benzylic ether reductase Pyrc5-like [Hordeum vulgare subsp. vulgare]